MEDKVLETVVNNIGYEFDKDILVKPMKPIMITVEMEEQIPNGKKDSEGFNLYDTKKTTKKVESDFAEGIVIALPSNYEGFSKLGDKIVYPKKFAKHFDLFKDSQLVKPYDVIAKNIKK